MSNSDDEPYELNDGWYWTNPIHGGKVGPFRTYADASCDEQDYYKDSPFV